MPSGPTVDYIDIVRSTSTGIPGPKDAIRLSFGSSGLAQSIDGPASEKTMQPPLDYIDFVSTNSTGIVGVQGVVRISRATTGLVMSVDGAAPVVVSTVTI